MNEQDLMDKIFGTEPTWGGFKFFWCDLCECYSIECPTGMCSSCNSAVCEDCKEIQEKFKACNPSPISYVINDDEKKAVNKYLRIKQLLRDCLSENQTGFDLDWLYYSGKLCPRDWETFDELAMNYTPYDVAIMEHPEKFKF